MKKREVPKENLIKLWASYEETCSREEYLKKRVQPIRKFLAQKQFKSKIKCLVLMYGVPLRIAESLPTDQITDRKAQALSFFQLQMRWQKPLPEPDPFLILSGIGNAE